MFYCMLLHIAIDRMRHNKNDEHSILSILCDECKNDLKACKILANALKMNIYDERTSGYRHRTPFQCLVHHGNTQVKI